MPVDFGPFVADFRAAGGRLAFGITGSGPSLRLIDALETAGVEFTTTGHESTAALMAGAAARVTGAPALAVSIKGPGFMNLLPGLLCNAYEGHPSISLSEAYARGPGDPRGHKWLDHRRAAAEFLKQHVDFDPRPGHLGRCWARASEEFPGPVHIDLVPAAAPAASRASGTPAADVEPLVARVAACSRPLVIAGSAGLRAPWGPALGMLAVPVFTTPAGKGLVDETRPSAAGVFTGAGKTGTPETELLPRADLVITIGVRAGEILTPAFTAAATLHIDTVPPTPGWVFPGRALRDPVHLLGADDVARVIDALHGKRWGEDLIAGARVRLETLAAAYAWSPVRAMRAVETLVPDAVHVLDTGNFTVLGEHFLRAGAAPVLGTPNGRYLGAALGYALGAAFALPDRPVVLWIGDGGLRALVGELALAGERGCRLLVLVMRDGHFGSIRASALGGGLSCRPVTLSARSPARIATALGLDSATADDETRLCALLEDWCRAPRPALYECAFDPDDYMALAGALR